MNTDLETAKRIADLLRVIEMLRRERDALKADNDRLREQESVAQMLSEHEP